jgi:hypothetical protein
MLAALGSHLTQLGSMLEHDYRHGLYQAAEGA